MLILKNKQGMNEMNQKQADKLTKLYCEFFQIPLVVVEFATAKELGYMIDGCYFTRTKRIWIRRNPSNYSFEFTLAHEIAHAWQHYNSKALDCGEADVLAMKCTGLEC